MLRNRGHSKVVRQAKTLTKNGYASQAVVLDRTTIYKAVTHKYIRSIKLIILLFGEKHASITVQGRLYYLTC